MTNKYQGLYEMAIIVLHLETNFGMAQIQLVEDDY